MRYIEIPYHQSTLRGTIMGTIDPRVVCIHGASDEGAARFGMVRHHLAKVGIASLSFDFIGAGQTAVQPGTPLCHPREGGDPVAGEAHCDPRYFSLKSRFEQACTVIDAAPHHAPLALIGASMGADTAIRLTQNYPTSALVLFVPGVYAKEAYTAAFTEEFTTILHEERSWERSESFDILSRFQGTVLIIAAENDMEVPREIIDRLFLSAAQAKHKELYVIPRSSHQVLPYLSENQKEFARVFEKVYHAILE